MSTIPTTSPFGDPYRNHPNQPTGQPTSTLPQQPGYHGHPNPPPNGSNGGTGPTTPGGTADQQDALAFLKATLDQYGLGSLADWAWKKLLNNESTSRTLLEMQDTPEFKQRFPAIAERQAAGLPPISPAEYIAYENQAQQMFRAAGMPPGFYDHPDDFTSYISKNVSLSELSQRVSLYSDAAYQVPAETRQAFKDLYGVDEGGLAAYFADPTRALPILQQQEKAGGEYGAAQRQHFGPLTASEAERLASLGIDPSQAEQGFGQIYQSHELLGALPGEQGDTIGRDAQLGLVTGDPEALRRLQQQAERRKAQGQSGGGYAAGRTGTTGLGSASTN